MDIITSESFEAFLFFFGAILCVIVVTAIAQAIINRMQGE